jgi:predicted lipoprotein with Yx(FWY)xxD motif
MRILNLNVGRMAVGVAAAVLLAGCGSGDSDASDTDVGDGRLVSLASVDDTDVLVDAEGKALYTADAEEDGTIRCVDGCESFWIPLEATRSEINALGSSLAEDLGVVERPDGSSQVTFDGVPLYTFTKDDAGELTGDGFTDDFQGTRFVWTAVRADGSEAPATTPDDPGGYGY